MLKTTPEERYTEAASRRQEEARQSDEGKSRQDGTDGGTQARPGYKRANSKEVGTRITGKGEDN